MTSQICEFALHPIMIFWHHIVRETVVRTSHLELRVAKFRPRLWSEMIIAAIINAAK